MQVLIITFNSIFSLSNHHAELSEALDNVTEYIIANDVPLCDYVLVRSHLDIITHGERSLNEKF